MLPAHWPKWTVILIGLALAVFTILLALALEPAAQALMPRPTPTATLPMLAYAAPQSRECISCHTDQDSLQQTVSDPTKLARLWINPAEVYSTHGRLGCVTCHRGTGGTTDPAAAHRGLVSNPSDYRDVDEICLPCHANMRTDIPEKRIHTPHERILWGIREGREVCACSNCHGPVAHGVAPVGSHEGLAIYCIDCHEQRGVPPERLKCTGCHISSHDIALDCETCHTSTRTWASVQLAVHPMPLEGRHAETHCFDCHTQPLFRTVSGFGCSDCHRRPHDFGDDNCERCHTPEGWGG